MSNIFKIKRGTSTPNIDQLAEFELGYITDQNILYIGKRPSPARIISTHAPGEESITFGGIDRVNAVFNIRFNSISETLEFNYLSQDGLDKIEVLLAELDPEGNLNLTGDLNTTGNLNTTGILNIKNTGTSKIAGDLNVTGEIIESGARTSRGTSSFRGSGLERTVAHGLGAVPAAATAFPTTNPEGYLGEVWIRFDKTNLYIGNTGTYTGALSWTAFGQKV